MHKLAICHETYACVFVSFCDLQRIFYHNFTKFYSLNFVIISHNEINTKSQNNIDENHNIAIKIKLCVALIL